MQIRLSTKVLSVRGFFLMEIIVLVIVFISFSTIIVGWYSHFSLRKQDIVKRGKALFIASNVLEMIRMQSHLRNVMEYSDEGFKIDISVKKNAQADPSDLCSFAEITVCVTFNERSDPVSLTTGLILQEQSFGSLGNSYVIGHE